MWEEEMVEDSEATLGFMREDLGFMSLRFYERGLRFV